MGTNITNLTAVLLAALLTSAQAVTAEENHKALATQEALAAADSGKKGDAKAVGEHAAAALAHAEAAQKEKPNPHLDAGMKGLKEAIEHSKMGHADLAGEAADGASIHLEAAQKSF